MVAIVESLFRRDIEIIAGQNRAEHAQKIRQARGQRPKQDIFQKSAADQAHIRLERQNERGDADERGVKKRELRRRDRIGQRKNERRQRQGKREDVFDEEEGGGALDVVDDAPALAHHRGQGGEVRVQKHQLRNMTGHVTAGRHGDAAVGVFER